MIIDLKNFIKKEEGYWHDLEYMLDKHFRRKTSMSLEDVKRFNYLYKRCSSDLAQLNTFAVEPELKIYLEGLIGQAYSHVHKGRGGPRFKLGAWLRYTLPQTVRKRKKAFLLSLAITLAGAAFGALALAIDDKAIDVVLPDAEYIRNPSQRVERAESSADYTSGYMTGSAAYFKHNAGVAILAVGVGGAWGIGTIIILFYNGVTLGSVTFHYLIHGHGIFVGAWLLPHGAVEIPAILLAGQAGLILGGAVIGRGNSKCMATRLRECSKDLVTIIAAVSFMMLWAGIIESNFSQTHAPLLPYWLKITVGVLQLIFLIWYFGFCGRPKRTKGEA